MKRECAEPPDRYTETWWDRFVCSSDYTDDTAKARRMVEQALAATDSIADIVRLARRLYAEAFAGEARRTPSLRVWIDTRSRRRNA